MVTDARQSGKPSARYSTEYTKIAK